MPVSANPNGVESPIASRAMILALGAWVVTGVLLRSYALWSQPTPMLWFDTGTYLRGSLPGAAPALDRPLGYSWFLRGVRMLHPGLPIVQIVQMVLGIATAWLFFAVVGRLMPKPAFVSTTVFGLLLVWPTSVILETYVLSETLFLFFAALGFYFHVRASASERTFPASCLLLGGAAFAAGALVRLAGIYFCLAFPLIMGVLAFKNDYAHRREVRRAFLASARTMGWVALPILLTLGLYASHYEKHHGVFALQSWSGIDRYATVARLIEPEVAGSDHALETFLRSHADGHQRDFGFIMWDERSPLAAAAREFSLDPPALNRWADTIAWATVARRPTDAFTLWGRQFVSAFLVVDPLDRQIAIQSSLTVYRWVLATHHVDSSRWDSSHSFRLRWLLALYRVKPMLGAGLLAALAMAATRRFRHVHQVFFALNALGFTAAVAMSIQPEQRHVHIVEVMLIVSFVMSIGQCLQSLGVRDIGSR